MAQFVLINKLGTRRAGEIIDTVQDPGAVQQLAAFGGVLIPLPSATLQPYIEAAQLAYDRADTDEAQDIMMAGYASSTSIAGGGTAGFVPIWTAGAVLGDSVISQSGSLVGINVAAPTAALSLPAGVAGAASLNVASGVAPGAPNSGDLWFDGTYLYLRASGINQPLNAPFGTGTPNVLTKWSSVSGLTDTAITEASGAIRTIGITNAGAGATNGTYSQQALTNITGTGTGATADIAVVGNVVTSLVLRSPGTGYAPGDTLSCATIGGGGFVFTVSAVSASDNASGNVTGLRFGAGTSTPRGGIDLASGLMIATSCDIISRPSTSGLTNVGIWSSIQAVPTFQVTLDRVVETISVMPRVDYSLMPSGHVQGVASAPQVTVSNATQVTRATAYMANATRFYAGDTSNGSTTEWRAALFRFGPLTGVGATSTSLFAAVSSTPAFTAVGHTVGTLAHFYAEAWTFNVASTITNYYGFRQLAPTGVGTITNRWGVSVEDAATKSAFWGNVGVGNALDVGAGKVIGSLTLTNAGAGATNGAYSQAALTGGSGTGATADIVVAGNVVTSLVLRNPGQGYVVGDTLSTAAIGGAGFVFTVASTASILRSDGTAVAARIGAGTTTPVSGFDTILGATSRAAFEYVTPQIATRLYGHLIVDSTGEPGGVTTPPSGTTYYGVRFVPKLDLSLTTSGVSNYFVSYIDQPINIGGNVFYGVLGGNRFQNASMTGKTFLVYGISAQNNFSTIGAGNTISAVGLHGANFLSATSAQTVGTATGVYVTSGFSGAAHVVNNYYAFRAFRASTSGGATITNRWGLSVEDEFSKSAIYGNLGVGNALDVGAGKVIASLTLTNAGTGYTNGTYSQVALTTSTGSGSGATADIVVAGNVVTTVVLRNPGQGYAVSDTLSCASIGAGSNFLLTVATTASIVRSDGTVIAPRIGAGTTNPIAAAHVVGAVYGSGSERMSYSPFSGSTVSNIVTQLSDALITSPAVSVVGNVSAQRVDTSAGSAISTYYGFYSLPQITASAAGHANGQVGFQASIYRSYAADLSTSATQIGFSGTCGVIGSLGSATTAAARVANLFVNNSLAAHTYTNVYGVDLAVSNAGTITNLFGIRLQTPTGAGTITNRWGVSQEDTAAKNRFLGNVGVGIDPGAGKMIASLTLTNGGAGYTNGTYSQVALTNITGTGTGATADIVVAGGIVTTVVLRSPGQGYVVGNTLSSASIGAGAGFVLTVATVASTIQADGEIIAPRIGAGTTTPRASMDVAAGGYLGTSNDLVIAQTRPGSSAFLTRSGITVQGRADVTSANEIATGLQVYATHDVTAATTTPTFNAARFSSTAVNSLAGQTLAMTAVTASAIRGEATDLANAGTFLAGQLNAAVSSGVGATTTGTLWTFNCLLSNLAAGHTVTTGYGARIQIGATGNFTTLAAIGHSAVTGSGTITTFYGLRLEASTAPTITNRYPISQEDTLGTNFVRAKTHFGAAVGTAAATTASIEVTAQGTLNGDIRLNSANAVVDVSAASTNGVKFNNRGGAGITSTTQNWYEEGTYTPTLSAGWTATAGNFAGYWTRTGRLVTLTIQFTGGTNSGATGGSTISTPVGLTPARNGAGTAVNANGTALGNGVAVVTTAGTIINANAITTTTVDKTIVVQYEV